MVITIPALAATQPVRASYILHERATQFDGAGVGALSIKSFFGGRATYTVGRGRYVVDDRAYLVLNHGQPYAISIEAEAPVVIGCTAETGAAPNTAVNADRARSRRSAGREASVSFSVILSAAKDLMAPLSRWQAQ